jgi:ATP-dependent Lon protease
MFEKDQLERIPMLALRGISAFPDMLLNFDVERQISVAALDQAMNLDRRIFLLAQRDINVEDPGVEDLYVIGTVCFIKQILKMPGGGVRVMRLAEGSRVVSLREKTEQGWFMSCLPSLILMWKYQKSTKWNLQDPRIRGKR